MLVVVVFCSRRAWAWTWSQAHFSYSGEKERRKKDRKKEKLRGGASRGPGISFSALVSLTRLFLSLLRQLRLRLGLELQAGIAPGVCSNMEVHAEQPYQTLLLSSPKGMPGVLCVALHRPDKLNAMSSESFEELGACFRGVEYARYRCVLLRASGRIFTAGLDLSSPQLLSGGESDPGDPARVGFFTDINLRKLQDTVTAIEKCPVPVIAQVHGACIGAGMDIIVACCIRHATSDASFSIAEVNVGLAADLGTLQRLPKLGVNQSRVNEWAYTGRRFSAAEALGAGLISELFTDKAEMESAGLKLASLIAEKSPVAVIGTKANLAFSRDHSVQESLRFQSLWSSLFLQSPDLPKAMLSVLKKEKAAFSKM